MKNLLGKFLGVLAVLRCQIGTTPRRPTQLSVGLALCLALGATSAAEVKDLSPADAQAIRTVVQAQLDAFARDDAPRAFSLAAPGIRQMFGTAENFLAMVRTSYPVVHRPASVAFLKPQRQGAEIVLAAQMTDTQGTPWLAVYSLQRQRDKSWRISGCTVVPNEGKAS
jgi:Domain of unknown function (DUF4864)